MGTVDRNHPKVSITMTTHLCPRCRFHPGSDRIFGYCSWDCHDADADADDDEHEQHDDEQHDQRPNERGVAA